jgi:hypothetical protein
MSSHNGYADIEEFLYYAVHEMFEVKYDDDKADGIAFYENTIKPFDSLRKYIEEYICDQIPNNMMRSVILETTNYYFIWKDLITNCTATIEDDANGN